MFKKILLLVAIVQIVSSQNFSQLKKNHEGQVLEDNQIDYLAGLSDDKNMDRLYKGIAIPRVVGTATHNKVHNFIVKELQDLGFTVDIDTFEERTPTHGKLKFRNIIAKLNPNADRYLVLTAHYDSKYFPNEVFIGATDSAVPCAMILDLARSMRAELNEIKTRTDVSLLLLFLDGEEAFKQWGPNDSIYGAKHLAKKWHRSKGKAYTGQTVSDLDRIDAFVLLDLLGAPNPTFYSYFTDTQKLFLRISDAEDRLKEQGLLKNQNRKYFPRMASPSYVEDDHIPFQVHGVPILHIIPKEFPKVWHKLGDDMNAIDSTTVDNLNKIFRVFVAEYLHLPIPVSSGGGNNRNGEDL